MTTALQNTHGNMFATEAPLKKAILGRRSWIANLVASPFIIGR
jgi:hypothetical protein